MSGERLNVEEIVNIDCFIIPTNSALPSTLGIAKHAGTIFDLIQAVLEAREKDAPAILDFPDLEILNLINQKNHLFPIAAAVLDDVPGADYELLFQNSSFNLPRVGMLDLMKAQTDITKGANEQAQMSMSSTPLAEGVTKTEARMTKRAQKITEGVVRRTSASAPEPVSLNSTTRSNKRDEDELEGDDSQ